MNWFGTTQTMNMAILALVSLLYQSPDAFARGGAISHVDLASTRPIEELPPDVRRAVERWKSVCGFPLTARRSFVHYLGDRSLGYEFIALHFNGLSCDNKTAVCNDRGCLHQVYVSTGSKYRVVFTEYVQELTLTFLDHTPAVDIECIALHAQCPRILRWNGRRFERP
jgi:hypothetical protein